MSRTRTHVATVSKLLLVPVLPLILAISTFDGVATAGEPSSPVHAAYAAGEFCSTVGALTLASNGDLLVCAPQGQYDRWVDNNQTPILNSDDCLTLPNQPLVITHEDGLYFAYADEGGTPTPVTVGTSLTTPIVAGWTTEESCDGNIVADNTWVVTPAGAVYVYNSGFGPTAYYEGSVNFALNKPITAMAVTPDSQGYWLFASDGGVFSYGDTHFYGSTGNIHLNKPITAAASTPNGGGYWLAANDGGIFAFGNAGFYGSLGNLVLNQPVEGMTPTRDGLGYWMVASDGGIFAFGDATFKGSMGGQPLSAPIAGMLTEGSGYVLVGQDGNLYTFS